MKIIHVSSAMAVALALSAASIAQAQSSSPWLPIPGSGSIGLSYVGQTGDSAYVGSTQLPISGITSGAAQKYKRQTYSLKLGYGLTDSIALDASLGRGKATVGNADQSSGRTDSTLGVSWRVLDEYQSRSLPTLTLRAAAIINGSYEGARLAAIGKDASGYELAAIVGRQFGNSFRVWGGLAFEDRGNGVPNATSFDLNGAYSITPSLSLSVGYTNKKFSGNLDIGGPGFSPAAFQRVKEERETGRLGVSYAIASSQSVSLNLGKVFSGRNTVKDDSILGLGYSVGF
jgi:hypothetical protein